MVIVTMLMAGMILSLPATTDEHPAHVEQAQHRGSNV